MLSFRIDGITCTYIPIGISQISSEIPEKFSLGQNYPNPFNPVTHFEIRIADLELVKLVVYDISGKEVSTVLNDRLNPGTYDIEFNGSNLASGMYFYTLIAGKYIETKKMILVK